MKVSAEQLLSLPPGRLRARSLAPGLYMAEVALPGGWARVCDASGETLCFTGLEWLRRTLGHVPVTAASLCHQSAYDEMSGPPGVPVEPLEVPISWPSLAQG